MKNNTTLNTTMENACKIIDSIYIPNSKLPQVVVVDGGFEGLALIEGQKRKTYRPY